MKTLMFFSKGNGLLTAGICLLLSLSVGCSKQNTVEDDPDMNQYSSGMKTQTDQKGAIMLQGFTRFAFYATKEGRVITDGYSMNFLECQAELIFIDKKNFVLNTKEIVPGIGLLYREISFHGKITPGGQVKFSWPESWMELNEYGVLESRTGILAQVRLHTGMNISGQGINKNTLIYMGNFDGEKFFADMHIVGQQKVAGTMPFFAEIVDGPVLINFMIDLKLPD